MTKRIRTLVASFFMGASVFAAAPAAAQPIVVVGDGLIDVTVFNVLNNAVIASYNDVAVGVAAQIAANVCGVKVGPLAVLGRAVDRSGDTDTVCETGTQAVEFSQNN